MNLSFTCQAALRWGRTFSICRPAGSGVQGEMTSYCLARAYGVAALLRDGGWKAPFSPFILVMEESEER